MNEIITAARAWCQIDPNEKTKKCVLDLIEAAEKEDTDGGMVVCSGGGTKNLFTWVVHFWRPVLFVTATLAFLSVEGCVAMVP